MSTKTWSPPSWTQLEEKVKETDFGAHFIKLDEETKNGTWAHTNAKVRYFGTSRDKPRVKLYRDTAAWCPYCQKVWLLIEAKGIDYETEKVPMRAYGEKSKEFLQKVPRGLLPAIEIDGKLMTESLDIMFTLERIFQDPKKLMFPVEAAENKRAVKLLELERAVFGAWCNYLFRPEMPFIGGNTADFEAAMQQVDFELGQQVESPWFLPYQHPTIVDMQYVSHFERMVASAHYFKGFDLRRRFSNIDKWLTAFEALPWYMATKSDYYTHCMDIPPQYGVPFPNEGPEAKEIRSLIDPKQARLPVNLLADPELLTKEEAAAPIQRHLIEAAWSLTRNNAAIARFCCRACGDDVGNWAKNNPTRCELSDPFARPRESFVEPVSSLLATVAEALLDQVDAYTLGQRVRETAQVSGLQKDSWMKASMCLAYLRDRVGVPRDMSMPAAKYLRAYLGEAAGALRS